MPSAQGPIFCRKELREKVGVEVRFFSRTKSAQTTDILLQAAPRKNRTDFFSDQKSAHMDRFVIGAIVCDKSRRGPIVGWRHSDFYRAEVSAHGPIFVGSSSEKSSERFYIGAKVSAHEPIFTPIFCLRQKIGPFALGNSMFSVCWFLQTLNYRGIEKYDLVLVQCHDGMITNSINIFCVFHSPSTRARPNRFISFVIIASWHWTRTRT